jgi:hypothetical protein
VLFSYARAAPYVQARSAFQFMQVLPTIKARELGPSSTNVHRPHTHYQIDRDGRSIAHSSQLRVAKTLKQQWHSYLSEELGSETNALDPTAF